MASERWALDADRMEQIKRNMRVWASRGIIKDTDIELVPLGVEPTVEQIMQRNADGWAHGGEPGYRHWSRRKVKEPPSVYPGEELKRAQGWTLEGPAGTQRHWVPPKWLTADDEALVQECCRVMAEAHPYGVQLDMINIRAIVAMVREHDRAKNEMDDINLQSRRAASAKLAETMVGRDPAPVTESTGVTVPQPYGAGMVWSVPGPRPYGAGLVEAAARAGYEERTRAYAISIPRLSIRTLSWDELPEEQKEIERKIALAVLGVRDRMLAPILPPKTRPSIKARARARAAASGVPSIIWKNGKKYYCFEDGRILIVDDAVTADDALIREDRPE